MADTVQTLSLIVQAQEYRGDLVRQINRKVVLLKTLPIRRGGGQNIAWAAQSSGHIGESYTEGADAANFGSDAQTPATLQWGLYRSPFHVSQFAMDVAATTMAGPDGDRELWRRNQFDASAALAAYVETQLFSGSGSGKTIFGLDGAIGSTTNTYATIDRTANSFWQPYVVDPGSLTAPTLKQIRDDLASIYIQAGEYPDMAVCAPAVFNKVATLFDPNRRWTVLNTARGKIDLDAGYEGIEVDGCMFLKSKDATANQIYYINSNNVHIETLPDSAIPAEIRDYPSADDGYGPVPLDMTYELLSKTGPSSKAECRVTCGLVVTRPNSCGVRKNVATT